MKYLLDTHLLIWASSDSKQLSRKAREFIENTENALFFSALSIWEIAIKTSLGRADFALNVHQFRRGLLDAGYEEIPLTSNHALHLQNLPHLHKDPFDRMLVAQATSEGIVLLTADKTIAAYAGPIQLV